MTMDHPISSIQKSDSTIDECLFRKSSCLCSHYSIAIQARCTCVHLAWLWSEFQDEPTITKRGLNRQWDEWLPVGLTALVLNTVFTNGSLGWSILSNNLYLRLHYPTITPTIMQGVLQMSWCYPFSIICLIGFLSWSGFGCTLSPKVNVSEGVAKSAASELGTGMEGAAKTFGAELAHASKPYEEELLARVSDLTATAKELIEAARTMPTAFGEAVTDRLVKERSFQNALRGFSVLAQSPEHLASAVEKGPDLLKTKIEELQAEFKKEDGFVTQQRAALFDGIKKEREAITEAIRQERANAMKDFDALTKSAIDEVFSQATRLVQDSLWLVVLLVVVLWGLPFASGFFVGRLFGRK